MEIEIFKTIPNYESYQVSNLGNVKSLSRIVKHYTGSDKVLKEKILKPGLDGTGYLTVLLTNNNGRTTFKVHQIIAMVFLNHIPDGTHNIVVDHINNIKIDNRLENLQLINNRENCSKDRFNNNNLTGITFDKRKNKYQARIIINNKKIHLGLFNNKNIAHLFYKLAINNITLYNGNNNDFRNLIKSIYE